MKIRVGFVSNSSSSSFCLFGVTITKDEIKDYFNIKPNKYGNYDLSSFFEKDIDYYDFSDDFDTFYIGKEISLCPDNVTMGDFKKQVMDEINSKVLKPFDARTFGIMSHSWYDG